MIVGRIVFSNVVEEHRSFNHKFHDASVHLQYATIHKIPTTLVYIGCRSTSALGSFVTTLESREQSRWREFSKGLVFHQHMFCPDFINHILCYTLTKTLNETWFCLFQYLDILTWITGENPHWNIADEFPTWAYCPRLCYTRSHSASIQMGITFTYATKIKSPKLHIPHCWSGTVPGNVC